MICATWEKYSVIVIGNGRCNFLCGYFKYELVQTQTITRSKISGAK